MTTEQTLAAGGTPEKAESPARGKEGMSWQRLVLVAGVAATLATGTISAVLGDLEGGAVAAGLALSTALLRFRRGTVGAVALALISSVTLFFMATAALVNIRHGSSMGAVFISSVLTSTSLLALVSAIGFLARRHSRPTRAPRRALSVAGALLVGLLTWGASVAPTPVGGGDIRITSENVAFSESQLVAPAGDIEVTFANNDLFWHTFTIESLGVDLRVPVGAELTDTFTAGPGVYEFVCAIPGHADAGMRGTLTVTEG